MTDHKRGSIPSKSVAKTNQINMKTTPSLGGLLPAELFKIEIVMTRLVNKTINKPISVLNQ